MSVETLMILLTSFTERYITNFP